MRYGAKYQNTNGCICYDYIDELKELGKVYAKALNGRIIVKTIKD